MARIRTIKPEVWMSPQVMNLPHGPRLLFLGLITQADDEGRGVADARRLKAAVFPGDDVTRAEVDEWLVAVATQGLAVLYDGGAHGRLYWLPTWRDHQSIDRPKPSRYPAFVDPSSTTRRTVAQGSAKDREGSEGSEGSKGSYARAREAASKGGPRAIGEAAEQWLQGVRRA